MPPPTVTLTAQTSAPSFTPGSTVTTLITLTTPRTQTPPQPPPTATYIICQFSGRWSSDRAWLSPHAHSPSTAATLDDHTTPAAPAPAWHAALADANAVGGGGRAGHSGLIFRSKALLVCEREQLPAGTSVAFRVTCLLPDALPPTLRGTAMRYAYTCHIVAAFDRAPAPRTLRLPFRVVPPAGPGAAQPLATTPVPVPAPRPAGPPKHRFLDATPRTPLAMAAALVPAPPPDDIDIALALSLNGRLTPYRPDSRREAPEDAGLSFIRDAPPDAPSPDRPADAPRKKLIPVYAITRGTEAVAKMYLASRAHHLGGTISAVFHFAGDRPCYRLGARLEAQERLSPSVCLARARGEQTEVVFRKLYGEHGEFVMASRNTHVTFSIPHDAPPSFATEAVTVRWLLHFVFLIPRADEATGADGGDGEIAPLLDGLSVAEDGSAEAVEVGWKGGAWAGEEPANWTHLPERNVDVLRWTLPIVVSGEPGSLWGTRSSGKIEYTAPDA